MKVVIIGAGGQGRVVLEILRANHQFEIEGFIDNDPNLLDRYVDNLMVIGDMEYIAELAAAGIGGAIVAIGDNNTRENIAFTVENKGIELINAIHPSANIARSAEIGSNVVVAAGATICTCARIGNSAIINTGAIVEHECIIRDAVHICPGVRMAGRVTVGNGAFVGIGSTIIQNIRIGENAIVGAGAVVIEDVPDDTTVVGVPARIIKQNIKEPCHVA